MNDQKMKTITPSRTRLLAFSTALWLFLPNGQAATAPVEFAARLAPSLACPNFSDEFYEGLYDILLKQKELPHVAEMSGILSTVFTQPRLKLLSKPESDHLLAELIELYELVAFETPRRIADDPRDVGSQLEAIAAMEMGDRTTPEKSRLQDLIQEKLASLETRARAALPNASCPNESDTTPIVPSSSPVAGALKTFATAYQSCEAATRPALTRASREVRGIEEYGHHSDGIGLKRRIASIDALIDSHPYLSRRQQSPPQGCYPVLRNPLIYDYGGKPFPTTDGSNVLDLFTNAGSGTDALGIDCSGFVYTAFAAAGLKMKKKGRLKASGVFGVRASMWRDPRANGLTCFERASFSGNSNLRTGDVLASRGHVIMIESVGADPFGIAHLSREADCRPEKISVSAFDFTVVQSAPVKGGLGIDRYRAADYLPLEKDMAKAMIAHAVQACLAKTKHTRVITRARDASLVRHNGARGCFDSPVHLKHQECVASCAAFE